MSLKDDLRQHQIPVALFLISALAFALRVYKLDVESLWLDEVWSSNLILMDIPSAIRVLVSDVHPPFYFILLYIWSRVAGQNEFSLRFLSAFLGPLTAATTYRLARGLFGRRTALVSGLLLALCPYHVYYSQELRMYTLTTFLGLVGACCFFQALETHRSLIFGALSEIALLLHLLVSSSQVLYVDLRLWASSCRPAVGVAHSRF